jgi:tetratricopeptide (TPR) repeat protein
MTMISKEKLDEQRRKLLLRSDPSEVREKLKSDLTNPELWYELGMAISDTKGPQAGIEAFSEGLKYCPFDASLYFGRGRKNIGLRRYWRCIADITVAIRIQPEFWNHWYYRGIAHHLNGSYENAIRDLRECFPLTNPEEYYPMADWIFLSHLAMGDKAAAVKSLEIIECSVIPPTMDFGYRRSVMLYKGLIKPENFLNEDEIRENSLAKSGTIPGRLELEMMSISFGLYAFYELHGETEKANNVIRSILRYPKSPAFAYIKADDIAKSRGL